METYSRVTRFCILCNYVSRIIDPLASRCSKYRFSPLDSASMKARLEHICAAEGLAPGSDTLDALLRISGGDMRKAITFLQSSAQLHGPGAALGPEAIIEISGAVSDKAVLPLLTVAMGGEGSSFDSVRKAVQSLLVQGYPVHGILEKLCEAVISHKSLPASAKAALLEKAAAADKRLCDGADEELQLVDVAATLLRGATGLSIPADKERCYL